MSATRYNLLARLLHWVMAILLLGMLALGWIAADLEDSPLKLRLFFWHKSFGILLLGLIAVRLGWRLLSHIPALPEGMKVWEKRAASSVHWSLYALLFALPLTGWLLNSAANVPFAVFGFWPLPEIIEPSRLWAERFAEAHEWLVWGLVAFVAMHVLAAFRHQWQLKDQLLQRMALSRYGVAALSLLTLVTLLVVLLSLPQLRARLSMPVSSSEPAVDSISPESTSQEANQEAGLDVDPATPWQVDYSQSELGFTASYDGVAFNGQFTEFEAEIRFDTENLPGSRFAVSISTPSVTTRNQERDEALAGAAWFGFASFPLANYETSAFTAIGNGQFGADGQLTIRDRSKATPLIIDWSEQGDIAELQVSTSVKRLDFDIGTGMWADDTIGHDVEINAKLVLQRASADSQNQSSGDSP